jgi:uncharacterized protein YndB with AHSA1/START domain
MIDRIERDLLLPAPPERVWDLITDSGWLADEVALELTAGGGARFVSDGAVKDGWVEEATPPVDAEGGSGRLAFWWSAGEEVATRVELTLEPAEDGCTLLRVSEARPLELLDAVGIPLPGSGGASYGPALLAAA